MFLAELLHSEGEGMCAHMTKTPCERCLALAGSLESTHLLGTCYYRSGRLQQARHLLAGKALHRSPSCDLLYAQCCLELGE